MFKLISDFFGLLFLLFLLLSPLFLLLGAFLIWRGSGIVRVLGWLLILLVAYYKLSWISPWYVTKGSELVQVFELRDDRYGPISSVRWMEASNKLLLAPPEWVGFSPKFPEIGSYVLVVDIEARKTEWQPITEVNLDATTKVESLPTGPSRVGTQSEFSFVGFSLPILFYQIPWIFSEISGWQWEKTYFGWWRDVVRESESGPVVVELNQIVFNHRRELSGASSRWVMGGKFSIVEPYSYSDPRVLVLGPFNTSQDTQSTNNKHKE
jgi:hypothetical protein